MNFALLVVYSSFGIMRAMRAEDGPASPVHEREGQQGFSSSCGGVKFDGPKYELGAGADGIASAIDLADPPGEEPGAVLKASNDPKKDKLLLDECAAGTELARASVEHIMQCLAVCEPDTCAGDFCGTGRAHIVTYPRLEEFLEFGMDGKVSFGDNASAELARAATIVGRVTGQMLGAGYVNADQGNNIMYRPDGTPLFIDFGKAGWMGKRGGSFPFVRIMVQKIIETFPSLGDWDEGAASPFDAQKVVAQALRTQLAASPPPEYSERILDYLDENFL